MSRAVPPHALTADRLTNLRRIATGVTRVSGEPWTLSRTQAAWFAREGYLDLGARPAKGDGPRRRNVKRDMTLTDKARKAIAEDDARIAAIWETVRREMMP